MTKNTYKKRNVAQRGKRYRQDQPERHAIATGTVT